MLAALEACSQAVLVAPPGAGKTTRVPLALLGAPWRRNGRVLVLEPRRIAARGAASHMAALLGERIGETVGVRTRLDTRIGPKTSIEVITEGVFTRLILDDPTLDGVAAVLFDEFHERSLDADLGLALALDAQRGLREDLRLLVMSATLDDTRIALHLGGDLGLASVIRSEGRAYPVETRYLGHGNGEPLIERMTRAILTARGAENGSILAFLPGQGEILRVAERLRDRLGQHETIDIAPLFGALDPKAQDLAISPPAPGRRKIVLATSVAETSITIEGVRVVIDSGQARVPRFEPGANVTRLETVRVSRASADQRRGRAGRTEPGVCYRLWDQPETQALKAFADPEIVAADLSGLVLDCVAWGVTDATTLPFLDSPPKPAIEAAITMLRDLGALVDGRLTPLGVRIGNLPLPAPLARMILDAGSVENAHRAAEIAAVLVERGLGGTDVDITHRIARYCRERGDRADQMRRQAHDWIRAAGKLDQQPHEPRSIAQLLALAFPDRIGKARGAPGHFVLANGRGCRVDETDALARAPFIVVADMSGTAQATRVLAAAPLTSEEVDALAGDRITVETEITFDTTVEALRARRVRRLGAITLTAASLAVPKTEASAQQLAQGLARRGIDRLAWSKTQTQLRDRLTFLRAADPDSWPDLSGKALSATAESWLAPFLLGKLRSTDVDSDVLAQALEALIPWHIRQRLDAEAPTHFLAPTGNSHAIVYEGPSAPLLAIRVQELFGLNQHPTIAGGRLPLTLELLSPAHRPIQITRDLPGFWRGSWGDVKADMRGRYPRHPWPDDPASAAPTARVKPRGT